MATHACNDTWLAPMPWLAGRHGGRDDPAGRILGDALRSGVFSAVVDVLLLEANAGTVKGARATNHRRGSVLVDREAGCPEESVQGIRGTARGASDYLVRPSGRHRIRGKDVIAELLQRTGAAASMATLTTG